MSTTTRVTFRDLTKATEPDLRALNAVIFPVRYGDKFYEDCARAGPCTQLAYDANGACVGAVACRLEMNATRDGARLYIMTLGVLNAMDGSDAPNLEATVQLL